MSAAFSAIMMAGDKHLTPMVTQCVCNSVALIEVRSGDWTAEAIEERKWLRSLVRSFAKTGTTE
jgi:hypothetical protein